MVSYLKTHSLHFSFPPCGVDIKINLPLHDTASTRNLLDFADVYVWIIKSNTHICFWMYWNKALKSSSRKKEGEGLKKERVIARWRKKPSEKKKKELSYLQALLAWHWCWSRQHCWWLCTRKWLRLCVCAVAGSAVRSPSHHQTQSPGRAGAQQKAKNVIFRGLLFFSEGITLLQYINYIHLDLQIAHCLAFVFFDLKEFISFYQLIKPFFMSWYITSF